MATSLVRRDGSPACSFARSRTDGQQDSVHHNDVETVQ